VQLCFEPVVDLGAREAPLAGDFLSRQLAAAGQLAHLAHVALEVGRQLLQVHRLVAHVPPLSRSECPCPARPCLVRRARRTVVTSPARAAPAARTPGRPSTTAAAPGSAGPGRTTG